MTENSAINKNVSKKRPEGMSAEEARMYDDFQIGGHERDMPETERLAQLASFIDAHYDKPAGWEAEAELSVATLSVAAEQSEQQFEEQRAELENYLARLPDRITHAAMIMLGSAVDHSLPVTAFAGNVGTRDDEFGRWYIPENPHGVAVAVVGGWWYAGAAREMSWEPEIAGLAGVSGRQILSVHFPLQPEATVEQARAFVRQALESARGDGEIVAWGKWAGADLLLDNAELVDAALAVTFPSSDSAPATDARVLVQDLVAQRHVATPMVSREALQNIAEFWDAR